jgi:PTS system beta-glucosides-specific IIC component
MGLFDFLKKKESGNEILGAPIEGEAVESAEISDPTFGMELLGKGMAIKPAVGKVYAPVNGTVTMVFDTKHAISITSEGGAEILIHIGLDTVSLNGAPFTIHVNADDKVKKGDLIAEFDMDAIKAAGLETITPVIICNTDDFKDVVRFTGKMVKPGDDIIELVKE